MIAAIDVHYFDDWSARAGAVLGIIEEEIDTVIIDGYVDIGICWSGNNQ